MSYKKFIILFVVVLGLLLLLQIYKDKNMADLGVNTLLIFQKSKHTKSQEKFTCIHMHHWTYSLALILLVLLFRWVSSQTAAYIICVCLAVMASDLYYGSSIFKFTNTNACKRLQNDIRKTNNSP